MKSLIKTGATRFFYQHDKLVTISQPTTPYTILHAADILLAEWSHADAGWLKILATDKTGTVLSESSRAQQLHHRYTAYGYDPIRPQNCSLFGFNSERLTPLQPGYLLGTGYHRVYNTLLMRLQSPDTWAPFGESIRNPYAYCIGDPVNYIDVTGHQPILAKLLKILFDENIQKNLKRYLSPTDQQHAAAAFKPLRTIISKDSDRLARKYITRDNFQTLNREKLPAMEPSAIDHQFNDVFLSSINPDLRVTPIPIGRDGRRLAVGRPSIIQPDDDSLDNLVLLNQLKRSSF